MLYALGSPLSFLVLAVSFFVVVSLHGWLASLVADRLGERTPRAQGRLRPDPRRQADPFGIVAAALGGVGWPRPVDLPRRGRRGAAVTIALVGPLLDLVLGLGALAGFVAAEGLSLSGLTSAPLQAGASGLSAGGTVLLLFGLVAASVGLLSLVPLPPLDGGRLLFALAPRSYGWQRAEHLLVEQNAGLVALLVLLVLPLGRGGPLLLSLLDLVLPGVGALVSLA